MRRRGPGSRSYNSDQMNPFNPRRLVRRLLGRGSLTSSPRYTYSTADTVVSDFAEFSGMPLAEICHRIANYHTINAADWASLPARGFAERAANFYEASQNYVFDTLSANTSTDAVVRKLNGFNPAIVNA